MTDLGNILKTEYTLNISKFIQHNRIFFPALPQDIFVTTFKQVGLVVADATENCR